MTPLLKRLLSLWSAPPIRLPRRLDPAALQAGDRVQIGPRLWRIFEGLKEPGGVTYHLVATEGAAATARLRWTESGWRWSLGDREIELAASEIVHFPVSRECSDSRAPGEEGARWYSDRGG